MITYKPFNQKLYNRCDGVAKDVTIEFVNQIFPHYFLKKIRTAEEQKEYSEMYKKGDVAFIDKSNNIIFFECEYRIGSWQTDFKWEIIKSNGGKMKPKTLTIPSRKNSLEAKYYVSVNKPKNALAIFKCSYLNRCNQQTKDTNKMKNDMFREVPISQCLWFEKRRGKWQKMFRYPCKISLFGLGWYDENDIDDVTLMKIIKA